MSAISPIPVIEPPDWLQPVNPYPESFSAAYIRAVRTHLEISGSFAAQMLVMPSFKGEYVVRLHEAEVARKAGQKYFLTYVAAEKNIWAELGHNDEPPTFHDIPLIKIRVEFPVALGSDVEELWFKMLRRTRVSDHYSGFDGTSYEFGTPSIYGQTWSPRAKSPKLFVDLGQSLVAYCRADRAESSSALKNIEECANLLGAYLDEHPLA